MCGWVPLEGDEFPTLGYLVADWMEENLLQPDTVENLPFVVTVEQLDFLVHLYELDPDTGKRVRHRAVLSRPRGWGKSPFLAAIAICEALGPVLFDGWDEEGQPRGKSWRTVRTPIVQIAATTEDQTDYTWMPLLEMLRGSPAEARYNITVMDTFVALNPGKIEKRTSSAKSVKGARAVCSIMDQTETWLPGNGGVRLAQTLRNNATKVGGVSIESPNAFTIGENSVAEASARFWEEVKSGKVKDAEAGGALYYDYRGADKDTDFGSRKSLIKGLRLAYGDSSGHPGGCVIHDPPCPPGWVDLDRIATDFWDTSNDPAQMTADFLNIHTAASNAWLGELDLRPIEDLTKVVGRDEPVTLGFDGSEGRKKGIADSTVLIGYSVKQRHLFKVGLWEQPDGPRGEGWTPPKQEILQTVREFFETHNVIGFYADPSAGWAGEVKAWEAAYHRKLRAKQTANEPIRWQQRNVSLSCDGFAQLRSAIIAQEITYDGHPRLTAHFLNARLDPRRTGYVLKKADDNQDYGKIDAAWAAMLAYKAGLDAIGQGVISKPARRRVPRRIY